MMKIILLVALPIALAAQNAFTTISGTIVDPSQSVLPGARVLLIDAERDMRFEAHTDGAGRFVVTGLPQGTYALEADLPGFEPYQEKLTLRGEDLAREITLKMGTIQEVVSVTRRGNVLDTPPERIPQRPPFCGSDSSQPRGTVPGAVRVGGVIRTPRKVFHVEPVYPEGAGSGIVEITAVIGHDGFVTETEVTNRASPELARAAIEAVRQWEFDPTLLNCEPVEVRMAVVVDFL